MTDRTMLWPLPLLLAMLWLPLCRAAAPSLAPGLVGQYFDGAAFPAADAKPVYVRVDCDVQFASAGAFKLKMSENFAVRWDGFVHIEKTGAYQFFTESDDGSRLLIDAKPVIDNGGMHSATEKSGQIELSPGDHRIRLEYFQGGGEAVCMLRWQPPGGQKQVIPASVLLHAAGAEKIPFDLEAWKKREAKSQASGGPGSSIEDRRFASRILALQPHMNATVSMGRARCSPSSRVPALISAGHSSL